MLTLPAVNKILGGRPVPPGFRPFLEALDLLSRGHGECWAGNRSLQDLLHCSERTVREYLRIGRLLGLVDVVRDYSLTTRRRIVLLWKRGASFFGSVTANLSPHSPETFAVTNVSPPTTPPVAVPEGNSLGESDGCAAPPPPPPGVRDGDRDSDLKPIVERAGRIDPSPGLSGKLGALLRKWGGHWLAAALDRAEAKHRAEPVRNLGGYLHATLKGFEEDGGPPPPAPDPAVVRAREDREAEEFQARLMARCAAKDRAHATLIGEG